MLVISILCWDGTTQRRLETLFLSDLPGLKEKDKTVERLQTALPRLEIDLDLD